MARKSNQKKKVLLIRQILMEKTDDKHPITVSDIIAELARNGVEAERKTIYDDIDTLKEFGMDILYSRKKPTGYYLTSHQFELPELKLLVDAVQSSKFITEKKSNELIAKLENLTSKYEAQQLQRHVYVANRIKSMNETIYYNVDEIHNAISYNQKISFKYFEWTIEKQMKFRKDGALYKVSPWALMWNDENYYLVAYDDKDKKVKHYRVDKMKEISVQEERREGKHIFDKFDMARFSKTIFGMFGGEEVSLDIQFRNELIGVVIDRFGIDVPIIKLDQNYFKAKIHVVVSQQFYGWISGLGSGVKILGPEHIRTEYEQYIGKLLEQYK